MTPCYTNKKNKNGIKRYNYYRCTKTFQGSWDACKTKQVNANRLENYVFESVERVSCDIHYLDSLIFKLKYEKVGNRIGLELTNTCSEYAEISPEIFAQTLQQFVKKLPAKKGIAKNLWAKKFINQIVYSPEKIAISLYCKSTSPEKDQISSASGRPHTPACGVPENKKDEPPKFSEDSSNVVTPIKSDPTVWMIPPNRIHGIREKTL